MIHYIFDKTVPKNLPLLFKKRAEDYPDIKLQAYKNAQGKFEYSSYSRVYNEVICYAAALSKLGIKKGSNVALISDNRREWLITDLAIQSLGGADVPRGCDSMGNEIRFIIDFADCEFACFENVRQLEKVLEKAEETPKLKTAILFDKPETEPANCPFQILYFDDILQDGKNIYRENPFNVQSEIENSMLSIEPNDTATIIFTSGTTGTPKGVMLTHNNYISQLSVLQPFLPAHPGDWWLSILPVWHVFERLIQYVAIYFANGLAYSKPVPSILLADMAEIKPHWMCGVPRLWEALAAGVHKAMKKTGGIKYKLFKFFVSVGDKYNTCRNLVRGYVTQIKKRSRFLDFLVGLIPMILLWPLNKLGNALVFKKIQAKFGGRLKIAISGGGSLQRSTESFYHSVGLNLLEGYGLTETAPVISFRYHKIPRPGCVGVIFPTFEVKVVKEEHGVIVTDENGKPVELGPGQKGLILAKGSQVMKGYYKRPDLTEKVIDKDGFFNTGDIGLLTWDKEIKITGRAKDTIVLSDGENVEPAVIENELCTSPFIESAIVLGQDQKILASLIVPSKEAVIQYAQDNGLDFSDYEKLLQTEQIKDLIYKEVSTKDSPANGFRPCERIAKIALLPNSFKVGEELSAKQEMMRFKIVEKYASLIATLF